jgi:hypothetical protein
MNKWILRFAVVRLTFDPNSSKASDSLSLHIIGKIK